VTAEAIDTEVSLMLKFESSSLSDSEGDWKKETNSLPFFKSNILVILNFEYNFIAFSFVVIICC
jgi:hypothetical protein